MSNKTFVNMNGEMIETTDLIKQGNLESEKIMQSQLEATSLARQVLGFPGKMISGSKSGYRNAYPKNFPVFNSNLVTEKGKIWYGDLDLTTDESLLINLAAQLKQTVYVLYEMDGRFENESKPKIDNAVYSVTPEGVVGGTVLQYTERPKRGRLSGKLVNKE